MSSLTATKHSFVVAVVLFQATACAHYGRLPQSGSVHASRSLALTDAMLVDVKTGQLRLHQTVIVTDDRITAADSAPRVRIPEGSRVVNASGKYLLPGLTDTHVHLLSEWTDPPVDTGTYFGWILAGGVTSVRDMSAGGFERALALRAAASTERFLAPRIYVSAGPDPTVANPWSAIFQHFGTHDPAVAVREFGMLGIDGLKLQNFPRDTLLALIQLARAAKLPVYGHTVYASPGRPPTYANFTLDLVRAGLNGVVHATGTVKPMGADDPSTPLPPSTTPEGQRAWWFHNRTAWKRVSDTERQVLIDQMVAPDVWYEPTRLVNYYWFHQDLYDTASLPAHHPWRARQRNGMMADPAIRTAVLQAEEAEAAFIKRFYEAGGMVLAGSDEVPFAPFGVTEEMRLLVEAGLPPLAALQAATINAARAMHLDDRLGELEVGKLADILVLDANPLENITNVRRIHAVVAGGRLLDRPMLDALLARVGHASSSSWPPNDAMHLPVRYAARR